MHVNPIAININLLIKLNKLILILKHVLVCYLFMQVNVHLNSLHYKKNLTLFLKFIFNDNIYNF
jgi:hypothetical protein